MCATIVSRISADLCRWRRSDSAALPPRHSSRFLLSQPRNQPGPCVASAMNIFQPLRCFLRFYFFLPLQCESGKWGFIKSVQAVDVPVMVFACWKKHYSASLIVSVHLTCTNHTHLCMGSPRTRTCACMRANNAIHRHSGKSDSRTNTLCGLWGFFFLLSQTAGDGLALSILNREKTRAPRGPLGAEVLWSVHI